MESEADNSPRELVCLVLDKIKELGDQQARDYFEVSAATISAWKNLKTFPSIVAAQKVWDDSFLCQSPTAWGASKTADTALLLPIYESVEPATFLSLFRCIKLYGINRIHLLPKWRTLVVEARNDLLEKALLTQCQYFLFADADAVLPCGNAAVGRAIGLKTPQQKAARNAIERIMSHPADKHIVGALYKDRRGGSRVQCETAFRSNAENARLMGYFNDKTQGDELEETGWVGFGLVRIHRSVIEKMKDEARPGGLMEEIRPPEGRTGEPFGYFRTTNAQRGEDVAFCRRAQRLGFRVYFDPGCLLGHIGKAVYS